MSSSPIARLSPTSSSRVSHIVAPLVFWVPSQPGGVGRVPRARSRATSHSRNACSNAWDASRPSSSRFAVSRFWVVLVSRQGRSRPLASARSANPYRSSWRRWNEQLATDSPVTAAQSVAVAC